MSASKFGSRLIASFLFVGFVGLPACSLVVDTKELTAGKDGLNCADSEKVCPDLADPEGIRYLCADKTNPETGCARDSCNPCQVPGAVPRCNSTGECAVAVCDEKTDDCDNDETNGCETDISSDLDNCHACGRVCAHNNAVSACVEGVCQFVICTPPFADCDNDLKNGCETNTDVSLQHCGACGANCSGACDQGSCI